MKERNINGYNNKFNEEMNSEAERIDKIKCVVVGDGGSGKTSLLVVYTEGEFPEHYTPTVFENYSAEIEVEGKKAILMLWDTAGQEDYDRLRPLSYDRVDVIIVCYDVTAQASFENVNIRWIPETTHFCSEAPVVLVACKTDLRPDEPTDNDVTNDVTKFSVPHLSPEVDESQKRFSSIFRNKIITTEEGEKLAKTINASAFIECSAKDNINVNQVFAEAARLALYEPPAGKPLNCCNIL